jgi:hypothetical protein
MGHEPMSVTEFGLFMIGGCVILNLFQIAVDAQPKRTGS